MINVSCSRTLSSDVDEALTHNPFASTFVPLSHCAPFILITIHHLLRDGNNEKIVPVQTNPLLEEQPNMGLFFMYMLKPEFFIS